MRPAKPPPITTMLCPVCFTSAGARGEPVRARSSCSPHNPPPPAGARRASTCRLPHRSPQRRLHARPCSPSVYRPAHRRGLGRVPPEDDARPADRDPGQLASILGIRAEAAEGEVLGEMRAGQLDVPGSLDRPGGDPDQDTGFDQAQQEVVQPRQDPDSQATPPPPGAGTRDTRA